MAWPTYVQEYNTRTCMCKAPHLYMLHVETMILHVYIALCRWSQEIE